VAALLSTTAVAAPSIPRLSPADVAPECKPSDDRDFMGSIHAGSSYEVPGPAEPTAKERQAFACGAKQAVVFWMQLPHEKTSSMLGFFGARLWGGPGPSEMHTDELLSAGDVLAIVSSPGERGIVDTLSARLEQKGFKRYRRAEPQPAVKESSATADQRIAAEVDCGPRSSDALRSWCPASGIAGAKFAAPPRPEVYVGLSVPVPDGSRFRDAARGGVVVSILALGGGKAYLGSLDPDDESERRELDEIQARIVAMLEGGKGGLRLPPQLGQFFESVKADLPSKGRALSNGRFTQELPARIYLVERQGSRSRAYVVVEEGSDERRVSVFPAVEPTR
jgi:hypothetical protein